MLVFVIFLMIFVGVTFALYQVYETHFNINFGNEKKLSSTDFSHLNELSDSAQTATLTSEWSGFDQAVTNILGPGFSRDIMCGSLCYREGEYLCNPIGAAQK